MQRFPPRPRFGVAGSKTTLPRCIEGHPYHDRGGSMQPVDECRLGQMNQLVSGLSGHVDIDTGSEGALRSRDVVAEKRHEVPVDTDAV